MTYNRIIGIMLPKNIDNKIPNYFSKRISLRGGTSVAHSPIVSSALIKRRGRMVTFIFRQLIR